MKYERLQYHIGLLARILPGVVIVGCTKINGRKNKSCLGQVFNFKIGCFYYERNFMAYTRPRLEMKTQLGNTKGGKYHCTVDLLFDLFVLVCFANKNKNCHLSNS